MARNCRLHNSGGRPTAGTTVRATVVDTIDDDLLDHVQEIGARFESAFDNVRGAGLLLAVELGRPALPVATAALEHGLLVGTAGRWLKGRTRVRHSRRYVTGTVYIGLGIAAALSGADRK